MCRQCRWSHFQWWYRWRAWSALHSKGWWHTRHLSEINSILLYACCMHVWGLLFQWWYRWRAWSALHSKAWWHTRHLSEINSILLYACCMHMWGLLFQWWYRWRAWSALHYKLWWYTRHLSEVWEFSSVIAWQCWKRVLSYDDAQKADVQCTTPMVIETGGHCLRHSLEGAMANV